MPSGTLAIRKTGTTPPTFEVMFVPNFVRSDVQLGRLTVEGIEGLRAVLSDVGVAGVNVQAAVGAAVLESVVVLRDVVLTDAFIAKYKL